MTAFSRRMVIGALVAVPTIGGARARQRFLRDDFRSGLGRWAIEAERPARVHAASGILDIDTPAGITLWFRPELRTPVTIDYQVLAVAEGGPNDAVSDVNAFWMACDPAAPDGSVLARPRSGTFAEYDTLRTYYVGIGGNRNTTTRLRRYVGRVGDRPILPRHDRSDRGALLEPNRWIRLRLIADGTHIAVECDGRTLFALDDTRPYTHGHFGLRTTKSHLRVRDLTISTA
ncbi:DUF6250 domain-containing protein [Sphingomonas sp. DT-204]|uniref:DUF6250 domain-containing protein n=1 Tax=Sphingomonas sp. DT-204 TaxID=3396166 RepID=UPI003F1C21FE